ncbi:MAG: DUF5652 family protein [Candidatus Pacebacteria bacterium]|nr:DUF5652 family protein [Candidatus Paceibacterota bacterium]
MEEFIANNQVLVIFLLLWSIFWKGLALWKAARRKEKWWFIILLVVNTIGLLEISYVFVFTRRINKEDQEDDKEELFQDNETI